ncbi:Premnaspirodiene oxygenase [Apostasia shenzhenica]|uniref:Premnaspirodiene oxygenase n=1 Tax=Apostasia shenzhenica TaxID=1088818 RepID=A0A2I0APA9_9ASPA|nr:Premnaspirodiene oxygenase [Apostasia shenzhenica]
MKMERYGQAKSKAGSSLRLKSMMLFIRGRAAAAASRGQGGLGRRAQQANLQAAPPAAAMETAPPSPNTIPWTLFFTIFITFVFLFMKKYLRKISPTHDHKLPPGPWNLPIVGSMHHLAGEILTRRLHRLAKTYGPILRFKLGERNFISITSPELAKEILKTHDKIFANRPPDLMIGTYIFYNNTDLVFAPYGKYWTEVRKLCTIYLFTNKRISSFAQIRHEVSRYLVERIRAAEGASPVNMSDLFFEASYLTIVRSAFGSKGGDNVDLLGFFEAVKETFKLAGGFNLQDLFPSLRFLGDYTGMRAKMKRIHSKMEKICNDAIEMHRRKNVAEGDPDEDLLDVLLRIQKEGALDIPFTMDNVKAILTYWPANFSFLILQDFFLGGTETTATNWEWILTELVRHPDIMKKAQLEIRNAFNGKSNIEESDFHTLPYLNMIIKESLRLHPPAPFLIPRYCYESCEIGGYTIPAGYRVMVNIWSILRNPESWDEPEIFRPERFQDNPYDLGLTNFDYLPFGGGRRTCPGISYGMRSLTNVLANVLYHFDWKPPGGKRPEELDADETLGIGLTRKNVLWLIGTPHK